MFASRSALFVRASSVLVASAFVGCGNGGSSLPSVADNVPQTSGASVARGPAPSATPTFNPWPTYGYDNAHNGFNPNSALFTDASIAGLHVGWQFNLGEAGSQTQPIIATNIGTHKGLLFVGGRNGTEYAVDAGSGKAVWEKSFGTEQMQCVDHGPLLKLGIQTTAAYDPVANVVYIVDGTNAAPNAPQAITVYKLDPATGNTLGSVNVTPNDLPGEIDFAHTGLTLASGELYLGTGSTCDLSSWRGRIAAVNVGSMTLGNTFYPTYGQGNAYSGGGVWGWGGAAVDASGTVYIGAGNADINAGRIGPKSPFVATTDEQAGYGEHMIALSGDLSTVLASHAVPYTFNQIARNLDLSGTPVLFTPVGCSPIVAIQGKAGLLNFYSASNIGAGPLASFMFAESADLSVFLGNGTYSPQTGLYYANVPTAQGGSIEPPGMVAFNFTNCAAPAIAWTAQFGADSLNIGSYDGQPRSAPTVTAGNVVFVATPLATGRSQLWALDAVTGSVLNGGAPVLTTPNLVRMPPVVDGRWVYVIDQGGHLYGLTVNAAVSTITSSFTQNEQANADAVMRW
jgi:outer membrane protein assembly factor BamB